MIALKAEEWKVTTDTVMGGLSTLSVLKVSDGLRLYGSLSHRNNGGFVSAKMLDGSLVCPQGAVGIRVSWHGDGHRYRLVLHERGRRIREYFECTLSEPVHVLLWDDFTHRHRTLSDIDRRLKTHKLMSIGVLLSNTHSGPVDFYLQKIEWVFA